MQKKQYKITNLFFYIYTIAICLLLIIGFSIYAVYQAQLKLTQKYENRYQSYLLADELRQSSDDLTRFARTYVMEANPKYEKYYWDILAIRNGEKARPEFYERIYWDLLAQNGQKPRPDGKTVSLQSLMRQAGFTEEEFAQLKLAQQNSDALVYTETIAMNAVKGILLDSAGKFVPKGKPDFALARRIMHDDKYHQDKAMIMKPIDDFFKILSIRTQKEIDEQKKQYNYLVTLLAFTLLFTIIIIIVAFWIIRTRIIQPINQLSQYSEQIRTGDLSQTIQINAYNEIGHLSLAINHLTNDLRKKSDFVMEIGKGNLYQDLAMVSEKDAMGKALLEMKANLQKIAEEDKRRNWETEGFAKFNELLREQQDLKSLCDQFISTLIKYLQANQGGIFLTEAQETSAVLNLMAFYGYDRKKFLKKQVLDNEGLIGQVFQERESIYLSNVPQEYLTITSGLGTASPKYLLISPIKNHDTLEGVLEIASFEPIEPHKIIFVEKICEAFASTITNLKINAQTSALLQKQQEQTEALKAQEEELRQNMEEMQTTQEEMNRKENMYKTQIVKLEEKLKNYNDIN